MPIGEWLESTTRDDRDAELLRFGDRDLVESHVDHEHRVGQRGHVLDAADVLLELGELALEHQRLLLDPDLGAGLDLRLHVLQALERALDGLEVGQHAAEPALVDVGHAAAPGFLRDHLARLALGADHQDRAAARGQLADELHRLFEERLRLLEVDDVDLVAMAVDVRRHLGVPEARLVSEMDAGFQHFTHRDRHSSFQRLVLESGSNRCARPFVRSTPRHLERAGSRM